MKKELSVFAQIPRADRESPHLVQKQAFFGRFYLFHSFVPARADSRGFSLRTRPDIAAIIDNSAN